MLEANWQDSFRTAFRRSKDLYEFLNIKEQFNDSAYPVFVPARLAKNIQKSGKDSALWRQFVPSNDEFNGHKLEGLYDPIGDGVHSKNNGIIHRYKNRLLFSPTTVCPVNCRYCFRKNELAHNDEVLKGKLSALCAYLDSHPEVQEVILTGGDPLILSNEKLEEIFNSLEEKVPFLRIHTRTPMILPERIDKELLDIFSKASHSFSVFNIAIHANHKDEFDDLVKTKIRDLRSTGLQLLSQSVLLKGVNDSEKELTDLYLEFNRHGVKSYYLHHPDRVKGAMNFYLSLEEGRSIYMKLRETLPGWAIPHYIIDPENGQGKTLAFNPESLNFGGQLLDRFGQTGEIFR